MATHASASIPEGTATSSQHRASAALTAAAALLLLAACLWLGLASLRAVPPVVPADAPATVFSAARAMDDLAVIAAAPRPIGADSAFAVHDYLAAEIRALGLEPVEQSALVTRHEPGHPETHLMRVRNVMTRVPGTDPEAKALLISGHYDSVATSTGASDCGMCAVVTLETLRAVAAAAAAGQPLRNDVIFLFTDGEEIGVAGAEGFMDQHPWAADVGLSVVFEGLGNDSAPLLYISGRESGAVVEQALDAMAGSGARPLASSFLHDFMWAVAGNTGSDLDAFVAGGRPGLGFIYLSLPTVAAYHTTADSVARLDPRSVQGMGDFALAMARHFGNQPLDVLPRSPDLVTFPLLPGVVARYSSSWALPLAVAAAIGLLAALGFGLRRRALSIGGLLAGLVVFFLSAITAVVAVTAVWWLTRLLTPALHNATVGGWYGGPVYLAAALTLALAIALGWRGLLRRFVRADRLPPDDLTGGLLLGWALLALLTYAALPGLSYLYLWPLIVAAVLWGIYFARGGKGLRAAALLVPAAVALWVFAAVFAWLWVYVGRAESFMNVPMAALPVLFGMPAIGLFAALLDRDTKYEIRDTSSEARSSLASRISYLVSSLVTRHPALVTFLLALALFAFPAVFLRSSAARPWANAVVYTLDADTGEAGWVAFNDSRNGRGASHALDEWTAQFLPGGGEPTAIDPWLVVPLDTPYPALRAAAPAVELPRTAVRGAAGAGGVRLEVERPAAAWLTQLTLHSAAPITAIAINGRPLNLAGLAPTDYTFKVVGREPRVTLDLVTDGPVTVAALDRLLVEDLSGLADLTGLTVTPRPDWMMPAPGSDITDGALVSGSFTIK